MKEVFKASGRAKDLVQQILAFSRQTEQERKPVQVKIFTNRNHLFLEDPDGSISGYKDLLRHTNKCKVFLQNADIHNKKLNVNCE